MTKEISNELIEKYNQIHEEKLQYILSSLSSEQDSTWTFQKSVKNMDLFFRSAKDSSIVETKTIVSLSVPKEAMIDVMTYGKVFTLETTPQGPIPPQEIFALHESHDDKDSIIYFMAMEAPAILVAPREFLLYRRTYRIDGKTIFMQMSIENEDLKPQRKDFVRGTIFGQAFVIEDDKNCDKQENGEYKKAKMTVFSHVNPGGRLPSFAINFSVKNQIDGLETITSAAVDHYNKSITPKSI
ncbi:hypothetical protein TRFO_35338 [Tritrichomonas foetus]|uniref:START domain-containing protein n=1 Tax=Tritrichomonas foetus TaxID=1144522 RepID=A0A1J4JGK0_9EUKA|nr:hypothetical protein TRFO_35338 [Tritrichomonas foetus]|eukprot:OHS98274.1 hypothetical protein TRFO_35338 [Tritrichomonas foetus]